MPDTPSHVIFAANVRRLREEQGLTQRQLAEKCGFHPTAVTRLEKGRQAPTLVTVDLIAAALGTDPATLITRPDGDS